ncbi:hypothetical protein EVAR_102330_1 [Eumeta japonica]|uniref:MADF domain-containing protein n=1 Tax=Eumeta variegata TaxID=151549 RepID=A0A4C1ZKK1_EUMVA|nr:hypothetical protein EVAR_102330_1 [Eumeta japonica]
MKRAAQTRREYRESPGGVVDAIAPPSLVYKILYYLIITESPRHIPYPGLTVAHIELNLHEQQAVSLCVRYKGNNHTSDKITPVVWNKTLEIYKDKIAKAAAWREISDNLNEDFEAMEQKERQEFGETHKIVPDNVNETNKSDNISKTEEINKENEEEPDQIMEQSNGDKQKKRENLAQKANKRNLNEVDTKMIEYMNDQLKKSKNELEDPNPSLFRCILPQLSPVATDPLKRIL